MELRSCGNLHYIQAIQGSSIVKILYVTRGRPRLKFTEVLDIYGSSKFDNNVKVGRSCISEVERRTVKSESDVDACSTNDDDEDKVSKDCNFDNFTLEHRSKRDANHIKDNICAMLVEVKVEVPERGPEREGFVWLILGEGRTPLIKQPFVSFDCWEAASEDDEYEFVDKTYVEQEIGSFFSSLDNKSHADPFASSNTRNPVTFDDLDNKEDMVKSNVSESYGHGNSFPEFSGSFFNSPALLHDCDFEVFNNVLLIITGEPPIFHAIGTEIGITLASSSLYEYLCPQGKTVRMKTSMNMLKLELTLISSQCSHLCTTQQSV
ncbi:hypothetical protein K1719_033418 [Acacia pycnantha]|nr:hypothetical protein K1719_033418 [Acacia pycnantha]